MTVALEPPRPLFRGFLHLLMAVAAIPALVFLMVLADQPREYVGAAIYGASMVLLYAVSARHHLGRPRAFVRRLDRAMIFVLIGGTYTPFCLLALGNGWGIALLSVVWGLAGLAALVRLAPLPMPRWPTLTVYLALGWTGVIAAVPFAAGTSPQTVALVAAGGALYSLGGLVHALQRPDPFPATFGYHEVFHVLSVLAGGAFFLAVAERLAA